MTQRLGAILLFYKPFFLWSMAVNVMILIFNPYILPSIITKLFLTFFVWYLVRETSAKRKLIFYKNLGISTLRLFCSLYIVDIVITLTFLLLMKAFV
ncbi:hypothetical protein BXY82_0103 [Gelidibacter sediminis]|uniref:Uncharacterized protein n=1 Tax=Gelidibacter sediminis TaxID=1608710 RepID=A0A4R7Q7M5_9FLAO|nr:hypothetical protein BXY82_0103 [Gelidibacter sediminis]